MPRSLLACGCCLILLTCLAPLYADHPESDGATGAAAGHSNQGEEFNEGPRQRAYLMEGMGKIHFPITTSQPEAQQFFTQGVGQLHGFWYFEAERSFRQVLAIDPDCAMGYWGLAMVHWKNDKRATAFINRAEKRKESVSRREQLWIESLANYYREPNRDGKERRRQLIRAWENISFEFPDDLESKAFLAYLLWESNGMLPIDSHLAVDALIQQVLAVEPMHPVHHYRIHLWNTHKDIRALDSAARCGQSAPGIAHMWHMSGHTYSELRRYADAAWQQEASARVDHAHMIRDRVMPEQIHNYAHNNEWLVKNLAYIGRVREAIDLAKNMVELPRLARFTELPAPDSRRVYDPGGSGFQMGRDRLIDVLLDHELWNEVIELDRAGYLEPTDLPQEQAKCARAVGVALFSRGDQSQGAEKIAALESIRKTFHDQRQAAIDAAESKAKMDNKPPDQIDRAKEEARNRFNDRISRVEQFLAELRAYQALAVNDLDQARKQLDEAKALPKHRRAQLLLAVGDRESAEKLARESADQSPGQVQPLANYADILYRLGKKKEAFEQFEKLRGQSAHLDLALPVFQRLEPLARELQLQTDWRIAAQPATDVGDRPALDSLGPFRWHPSPAPSWSLPDLSGASVSSDNYRGKPVVMLFYLGAGCSHCLEQLNAFAPLSKDFAEAGISIIAVSTDSVSGLQETLLKTSLGAEPSFPLVSDEQLNVFKAFRAFDDFEDMPLHGTFLIDGQGLIRWQDISFEPFKEPAFLLQESKRLLALPVAIPGTAGNAVAAQPAQE